MIINLQLFILPISLFFSPSEKRAVAADELCRRERQRAAQTRGAPTRLCVWFKRLPALLTLFFGSVKSSLPDAHRGRPNRQLENRPTERNQTGNEDGLGQRCPCDHHCLSNETSPEELWQCTAAFSLVRPDLTSLLAERKESFAVTAYG